MVITRMPAATVCVLFACLTTAGCSSSRESGSDDVLPPVSGGFRGSDGERLFLVPFLSGKGIPIVYRRPCWVEGPDDVWTYTDSPNLPFDAAVHFELAVWADGTVIWSSCCDSTVPDPSRPACTYYRAKLSADDVHDRLTRIDLAFFRNTRPPQVDPWFAAFTSISDGQQPLYIETELDTMEILGEYYYWDRGKRRTFPADQYTFEDFCRAVPKEYADYLRQYRRLRAELERLIPDTGEEIDPLNTVQWVFTPTPADHGGLFDSQRGTKAAGTRSSAVSTQ